ncbi:MAG: ParB N-terminal domain-containing protein [Caldilineales bacterium]|nr:ParB N-terminal domain-containing protein [Caldilineales bacterium]
MNDLTPSDICLRIVPVSSLQLHEEDDPYRVKRLMQAVQRDGKLKNPIIVARQMQGDESYVVLDGATRTTALQEMGIPYALVQIVDYHSSRVKLDIWHHIIVGLPETRLMGNLGEFPDLRVMRLDEAHAQGKLGHHEMLARLMFRNGQLFTITATGSIHEQAERLCEFVALYRGKAEVHRTVAVDLPCLLDDYPNLTAVVSFPPFTPDEIMQIAANGKKVPMGITRHLIAGRALGLGVPLEVLTRDDTQEEKNAWLEQQIRMRLHANKIRLYQEPVFVFDD